MPVSPPPFEVVHVPVRDGSPVVRRAADTADRATIAFDDELRLLRKELRGGELRLVNHERGGITVLRHPVLTPPSR